MVTVEQTGQAEAGDPFRDPPPPLPYPPQFQQQPFGGPATGPPPSSNNQNIPIQSQTQTSYPIPHPPAAAPQQVPMNTGAFNLQPMQDALPTDNNPYRKLHSQRTGQSEGSYPGNSTMFLHPQKGTGEYVISQLTLFLQVRSRIFRVVLASSTLGAMITQPSNPMPLASRPSQVTLLHQAATRLLQHT